MKKRLLTNAVIITFLILSACKAAESVSTETTRPTDETKSLNAQTESPVVEPSVTSVSITQTAEPTESSAPTSLNSNGPYILFSSASGIWITNPDSSFPTQLTELNGELVDLHQALSPDGKHLALVVRDDIGVGLYLVEIPSGSTKKIAQLLSLTQEDIYDATSPKALASYAITKYGNLAWQPDGNLLAFTGSINGPTSDVYSYDTQSGEITQWTDGPSQAIAPSWSPDGKYILHYGVSWVPPFGGAIVGYNRLDGAWAIKVSDGSLVNQPKPKVYHGNLVGWQDDSHYLIFDSDDTCYSVNLRTVDVTNGKSTPFADFSFYYEIAQSPENMALLFSSAEGCSDSNGEGIFLLTKDSTVPIQLADKRAYEVYWLPESGVFQAYPEALFSSDGSVRYDPPVYDKSYQPAISKQGYQAWEVIENQQGRVEVRGLDGTWKKIMDGFVDELIWDPINGDTLVIALQDGSLYSAAAPDFQPALVGNLEGRTSQAIWIP